MNNHFLVFSAGRDCAPLVRHNVASVISQTYDDYVHVVAVDDSQCDGGATLDEAMKFDRFPNRAVVGSVERLHWIGNAKLALDAVEDSIVVILDLDDSFWDRHVLDILNVVYQDPNVWATYGQYAVVPKSERSFNKQWFVGHCLPWRGEHPRSIPWIFSHLMTFRGFLWNSIKDQDLRGPDGQYFHATRDAAVMWPVVEMAGPKRVRFIDRPMVIYTARDNPAFREEQIRNEAILRGMPAYEQLP